MAAYYLNTFAPLVINPAGREAHEKYGIPPFVDGSIRREPDLEQPHPSISCLCRAGKFAPRLRIGDVVAYLTKPRKYQSGVPHRRLPAVLQVVHIEPSHEAAAAWYRSRGERLPNNCMAPGNLATPVDQSNRTHVDAKTLDDAKLARRWDGQYAVRARNFGTFLICRPLFRDLSWSAPVVMREHFEKAFGRLPGTQNPGSLPRAQFQSFLELIGIAVTLPDP